MPQTSMLNFFSKASKSSTPGAKTPLTPSNKGDTIKEKNVGKFVAGRLVWAKLPGYPWWPSMICNHPSTGKTERKKETHVQFFDDPVTRSWIDKDMIKAWSEKVEHTESDEVWKKGFADAKKVENMSNEERIDLLLVDHLPSDEELDDWDADESKELSPGSKENDPNAENKKEDKTEGQPKKRRRVMTLDSDDDSDGDQTFKPSKQDLNSTEEDEDIESGVSEQEPSTDEEADSPVKTGSKRKRPDPKSKKAAVSTPAAKLKADGASVNTTPKTNHFASFGAKNTPSSSPLPRVNDSTKKKLALFGADTSPSKTDEDLGEQIRYKHMDHPFLKPEKIMDKERRRPDNPDYDPHTLYVPQTFMDSQSPGQRQWWELKAQYFDVVLFFKLGKFYEMFHMDADVGVQELNLIYMKGEQAHAGFPEVSYSRFAPTLVEKGYKVARIEQTETPLDMEERIKQMKSQGKKTSKFDTVVAREVCQLTTPGTRVSNFMDSKTFEGEPRYLWAIVECLGGESGLSYGVAFIDTTIGTFHLGQFSDDKNLSRLRTVAAHYPPAEILFEKNGLSNATMNYLSSNLPAVRREALKPGSEFWETEKTLTMLAEEEYFAEKGEDFTWPLGFQPLLETPEGRVSQAKQDKMLAVKALGGIVWYLRQGFLDQELLSLKRFEEYKPVDCILKQENAQDESKELTGKHMVLDGISIRNLELLPPPATANGVIDAVDGSLLTRLDTCLTAMGKRTLRHWVVTPLLQTTAISQRQEAVKELISSDKTADARTTLKKIPDLERLISKIHTAGDAKRSKTHPDSRAIMFESATYSKRQIHDLIISLDGFKKSMQLVQLFKDSEFGCAMLRKITLLEKDGGDFPDLEQVLDFFDNAFDHNSARKEGKIIPSEGVDADLDAANANLLDIKKDLDTYLKEQKKHFGCDVKYWGTGKNRFQLEIPVDKVNKAGDKYTLASGTKKVKRYTTQETEDLLARQTEAETEKGAALLDIQRKMFHQFSKHAKLFMKAIGCVSLLDCLLALTAYSTSLETYCFPEFLPAQKNLVDIKEGSHPCLDLQGDAFIPNDTLLEPGRNLIILTGPNMGGKSTLMRQTGLLVVLAQMGTAVPASEMRLSPVDRIFTRLGAQDNIIGGESTFLVELQETSTILQHASKHSLVLIDELGRGTATYDGTAIAGSVVAALAKKEARTLFATHYHTLTEDQGTDVHSAHMACMIENEGHEDITQETITFLYKLVDGPCPKSHGFNAAKLAGLPDSIIRRGYEKAREFEQNEMRRKRGE